MLDVYENILPLTAEEYPTQPAELDDGGCFEPFTPEVSVTPAPKPAPKPKPPSLIPLIDRILRDNGCVTTPTDIAPEAGSQVSGASQSTDDAVLAQPYEVSPTSLEASLPPPRAATAVELFAWLKRCVLAQTHLPEDASEIFAFWVISSWFQDALTVLPCLVITGPAHEAVGVLHVLSNFCRKAAMLAGFRRSHLGVLRWGCLTNLVSEPYLDKRTAGLLSNLTDPNFLVVEGGSLTCYSKSTAIYAGENPEPHKIQNSIHIHITPANAEPSATPECLEKMIERLPVHLDQYRAKNLRHIHRAKWVPSGLSSETAAIATALGRCIVDAPELLQKMVALLKAQDQQHLSELSNSSEAIVLEATRTLSRDGREHAYAKEIAAEANRLLEARGETVRLSPEMAGHQLKGLSLRTQRLSQTGNGLTFDKATLARIEKLTAVYMMEDAPAETENLHGAQTTENN